MVRPRSAKPVSSVQIRLSPFILMYQYFSYGGIPIRRGERLAYPFMLVRIQLSPYTPIPLVNGFLLYPSINNIFSKLQSNKEKFFTPQLLTYCTNYSNNHTSYYYTYNSNKIYFTGRLLYKLCFIKISNPCYCNCINSYRDKYIHRNTCSKIIKQDSY